MAVDILFRCQENNEDFITVREDRNEIEISCRYLDTSLGRVSPIFYFDKKTAIKFAKTLRTEINKIKDDEQ